MRDKNKPETVPTHCACRDRSWENKVSSKFGFLEQETRPQKLPNVLLCRRVVATRLLDQIWSFKSRQLKGGLKQAGDRNFNVSNKSLKATR